MGCSFLYLPRAGWPAVSLCNGYARTFAAICLAADEEDEAGAALLPRVRRARGPVCRQRAGAHPAQAPRLGTGAVSAFGCGRQRLDGGRQVDVRLSAGGRHCNILYAVELSSHMAVELSPLRHLCRELGSGSWAEPPSPSTTISSSGLPSPKAPPPVQPPQQQPQHQHPGAAGGQPQGAAAAAAASGAAAGAGMPAGTSPAGGLPAVRTRGARADEAAAAAEALPDSPPSMAAVLRAEAGELSLTELPADEFLLSEGRTPAEEQQL